MRIWLWPVVFSGFLTISVTGACRLAPAWLGGYGVDAAFMFLLLLHDGGIHAF
jgi:hypothetical protein